MMNFRVLHCICNSCDPIEVLEPSSALTIDLQRSLTQIENSLDDLRRKYMGRRVRKLFHDIAINRVCDYFGQVTPVDFSSTSGCYLFHVMYDSDSDDEDMEHRELQDRICN